MTELDAMVMSRQFNLPSVTCRGEAVLTNKQPWAQAQARAYMMTAYAQKLRTGAVVGTFDRGIIRKINKPAQYSTLTRLGKLNPFNQGSFNIGGG